MVNESEEIRAFLESEKYIYLTKKNNKNHRKKLCDDLYDAELEFGSNCLKSSELSLLDIDKLLENDADTLEKFCIKLIRAEDTFAVDQEFNLLDENEKEKENEVYVGHSQTFLLTFAILFLLLRDRRDHLPTYLKKTRQPNAKKYQHALEVAYESIT
ncbi:hypothetical protein [Pseudomonas sp. LD120]|uniref:hypothetical protein n=1 Tax=Pseudomonas sp. LD120 TaxID=485751 RepID=UPI001356F3C6|nr:hypothetical protein [Pseudomonas sp. LD120]KAF0867290.1 hypothetical protein PLD_02170 [Pseudomonas sp. LD120]